MVSEKLQREIPFCTIFLVVGAVVFQSITLAGNVKMANSLFDIGGSVSGWSMVGLGLSSSFGQELNDEVEEVQTQLTQAIVKIQSAEQDLDSLLGIFGVHIDVAVNKSVSLLMNQETVHGDPMGSIMGAVMGAVGDVPKLQDVNGLLVNFLNQITPALEVVGKWILKFGPKIQAFVSQMGTTIDRAQLNFNKMMQHMMSSTGEEIMMFNTFPLYDMEHTGAITEFDVNEVGTSYGINAYQGAAGKRLFKKYAGNNSLIENGPEFKAFVSDKSAPYVMSILLRSYAKMMSQVSGQVALAKKRIDMSAAISGYLQLTCARNLTRVQWVTQMLTNGTLPEAFTATVLIQLALDKDNPNALTTVDIGQMAVGAMVTNNLTAVLQASDMLAKTEFFSVEGFNVASQPRVVEIVTKWITHGPAMWRKMVDRVGLSNLEVSDERTKVSVSLDKVFEEMPKVAKRIAKENMKKYRSHAAAQRIAKRKTQFESKTAELLALHLTGGRSFSNGPPAVESAAQQVVNGGVPCVPVTLEWAQWLAYNSSEVSNELQHMSYSYSKQSSSTTDSFNTQIMAITKKIVSFIGVMETYSTPKGIARLKAQIESFEKGALNDVLHVVESKILGLVKNTLHGVLGTPGKSSLLQEFSGSNRTLMQTKAGSRERAHQMLALVEAESKRRQDAKIAEGTLLSPVWAEVQTIMQEVMNLMPSAVKTVATAKADVQQVWKTLESIFTVLSVKGPGIFSDAAFMYKVIWVLYWFLLTPFTIGILFYGFWANGWMGGPQAADKTEYPDPVTCSDYCSCVYRACCACMSGCCDSALCFWSFIIIMQIVALLLFLMSILFTIIGGVDIFLATGCEEIYVINDDKICQNSMTNMQDWLSTFYVGNKTALNPMNQACGNHNLLLCEKIATNMMNSATYTIVGSFLACIFTFQLIFDTAILHERARMRRIIAELQSKEEDEQ